MTSTEGAIVPRDTTDSLHDLVSMFSEMNITKRKKNISEFSDSDDETESIFINGEKVVSYVTFHKYVPNILASLANGKTITIMDNRLRDTSDGESYKGALVPVPYRSDPLSRLCDENTVLSYDKVNHVIKLWDLRKNYTNYSKESSPKSIIFLSKSKNLYGDPFSRPDSVNELGDDLVDASSSKNYSLANVLTWPDSLPSVVVTYPDKRTTRESSIVIEELPDDWEDPTVNKREILPITYQKNNLKRKHPETCDDININVCKRSIFNCTKCNKATANSVFCDSCNWRDSKRKSTDDLQHEPKRLQTSNGYKRSSPVDLKMKRKIENDDLGLEQEIKCKRIHLESSTVPVQRLDTSAKLKSEPETITKGLLTTGDTGKVPEIQKGNLFNSKVVNLPKYTLNSLLLNSLSTTEHLDWKSKLRIHNCGPTPSKIQRLLV